MVESTAGGRPRGRRLDTSPKLRAVAVVHSADPKGRSRRTHTRTRSTSASVIAALTPSTHYSPPLGAVPGSSRTGALSGSASHCRLDHVHASARGTRPARVSFDVAQDREQMLILLNGERLESSLPHVAAGAIMPRVAPHVGRCQPMHQAAEFAVLAGPKREVEMIGHQTIRQDSHRCAGVGFGNQLDECVVVVGFVKHLGASIAAIEDMVGVSTQCPHCPH